MPPDPRAGGSGAFTVEVVRGTAGEFHARPAPEDGRPALWWFEVTRPALVLGSSQPEAAADRNACARAGVDVVRRRSGGGAVLVAPGDVAWFDLLVPRGHPRWVDDVGTAAWWVGEATARALDLDETCVHRGPMVRTTWSSLVCFAGVGPGEVVVNGRKAVGISQRRTRDVSRFQVAVYHRWDPGALISLLSPPVPTVGELAGLVHPAVLDLEALVTALDD